MKWNSRTAFSGMGIYYSPPTLSNDAPTVSDCKAYDEVSNICQVEDVRSALVRKYTIPAAFHMYISTQVCFLSRS